MKKLPRESPRDTREETWHVAFSHKGHFDNCGIGQKRSNLKTKTSISMDRDFILSLTRYTFPWPRNNKPTHRIPGGGIDVFISSEWIHRRPSYGGDRDFQFSLPMQFEEAIIFAKALLKMAIQCKKELEQGIGWKFPEDDDEAWNDPMIEWKKETGLYTLK